MVLLIKAYCIYNLKGTVSSGALLICRYTSYFLHNKTGVFTIKNTGSGYCLIELFHYFYHGFS